jgi:hypothetical protein
VKSKLLNDQAGQRAFVMVSERGDTVMDPLVEFLRVGSVSPARLTGIGALELVTIGTPTSTSSTGSTDRSSCSRSRRRGAERGEPQVHVHVVVGCRDTSVRGGHLIDAVVRPTLELIVEDVPTHLRKRHDAQSGLALIAPAL